MPSKQLNLYYNEILHLTIISVRELIMLSLIIPRSKAIPCDMILQFEVCKKLDIIYLH